MKFSGILSSLVLALLSLSWNVQAQEKPVREVDIHKNVKLVQLSISPDIPEDLVKQYQDFLPILEESLKESTGPQSDACSLTIRVAAGMKEIAKTKRPLARVSAFRRNSKQEYVGTFILYSYINSGLVNKEETITFLKKQILEPAECTE